MSGLSRTPGKRVWVNSPPRVRIPLAPPKQKPLLTSAGAFSLYKGELNDWSSSYPVNQSVLFALRSNQARPKKHLGPSNGLERCRAGST